MSKTDQMLEARMGWLYPNDQGDSVPASVNPITGQVYPAQAHPDDILRPEVRLSVLSEEVSYPLCFDQSSKHVVFYMEEDVLRDFLLDYEAARRTQASVPRD